MKFKRQSKIIELVKSYDIETQDDLADKLKESGFEVTQATISRDIRELKLTKLPNNNGKHKYTVMTSINGENLTDRFISVFREAVISIDYAKNIIVIKTLDGMAMAVAASIDSMGNKEIIGSIAGDDTIFCVVKTDLIAIDLIEKLRVLIKAE